MGLLKAIEDFFLEPEVDMESDEPKGVRLEFDGDGDSSGAISTIYGLPTEPHSWSVAKEVGVWMMFHSVSASEIDLIKKRMAEYGFTLRD